MSLSPADLRVCVYSARNAVFRVLPLGIVFVVLSLLPPPPRFRFFRVDVAVGVRNGFYMMLLVLIAISFGAREWGAGRLRGDPDLARVFQYRAGYLASALLATVIGLAGTVFSWAYQPRLKVLAPFPVAAMTLSLLSIPTVARLRSSDS